MYFESFGTRASSQISIKAEMNKKNQTSTQQD